MSRVAIKISSHHKRKTPFVFGLIFLLFLIQKNNAYEFKVGGSGDWSLTSTSYNQWAERSRFQIGDTLVFNYKDDDDSVFEVSKDDYNNCNTESPIAKHSDGHTVIKLNKSGPHYFISGVKQHCKNNEKVMIVVMAARTPPPSNAASSSSSSFLFSIGAFLAFSIFFVI